jgi:multidrug efflux pump subunit AcrA (membrane-fusion protein)
MQPYRRITSVLGAIGLVAAQVACGRAHETPPEPRPAREVRVATAATITRPAVLEAGGVVHARTTATLVARIMASVREVRVRPGDRVRAGQVLVVLDDRDLAANARMARSSAAGADQGLSAATSERDAAKAALVLARASHERVSGLYGKKSATSQELDEAVATLNAAEARVASADARVRQAQAAGESASAAGDAASVAASFALITAPFAGIVTEKLVEPGNMAAPGTPLVRVEDAGGFRLEVRVDESRAQYVRVGNRVEVAVDGAAPNGQALETTGEVSEVARALDADAQGFLVKIALPELDSLRSGMFGRARLPGAERRVLSIPAGAVVRNGQLTSVFVVDKGHAQLRLVSLGEASQGAVEVLAGVSDGEAVVVVPPPGLVDGQPVKVAGRAAGEGR